MSARYNNTKGTYTASSGEGLYLVKAMERLAENLRVKLRDHFGDKYSIVISKGNGALPKVLWLSIVPGGRSPSAALSVTICFGRHGEGVIAGLMVPKAGGFFDLSPVVRTSAGVLIDVDGDRSTSRYNNCFINPREWVTDALNGGEIIDHLVTSIEMLSKSSKTSHAGRSII